MKRFVVVGLGNFGSTVATSLYSRGHEVVTIDMDADTVDRIAPEVTRAVVGDARDGAILQRLGAGEADAAVISTGDDITSSVLATLALRDLALQEIYVKVVSHDHARVMEKLGVTETIFPERDSGLRLATRIASRAVINYVDLGQDFSIQEMAIPEDWIGRSLRELELPRRYSITIIGVHDMLNDRIVTAPDPDSPLKDSDTVVVAGTPDDLERVAPTR